VDAAAGGFEGGSRFRGRAVLLTGAASGIGRATAERLAAEGAELTLSDVNAEGLEAAAEACRATGAEVHVRAGDVSDEGSVVATVAEAAEVHGRLDVLVNVAGILQFKDLRQTTVEDFQRILGVNLVGTFLMCREAIPHLLDSGGNIVNTASTAALAGHPWTVSYSASKGGVYALTQTIAVEFGKQGIRANSVAPGSILTPIQQAFELPEGADPKLVYRIMALDKQRGPEAVAGAIAFLASDDAAHVNGTCLKVDGGTLA
jgi:meso-butanediol dehydrogenase / (S,S)-butanediol dehydrogenase / diacetyl reductase